MEAIPYILIPAVLATVIVYIALYMQISDFMRRGKLKAKGAKKRRRKLLTKLHLWWLWNFGRSKK